MEELASFLGCRGLRLSDKKKLSISLDIDGVLAEVHTPIISEYNKRNALVGRRADYTLSDYTDYSWGSLGSSWSEIVHVYNHVWVRENHKIRLIADAKKIRALADCYNVELVTQKDDNTTVPATVQWIKRHGLDFLPLKVLLPCTDRCGLNYDIYIDDNPAVVERVRSKNGKVLLLVSNGANRHIQECEGRSSLAISCA